MTIKGSINNLPDGKMYLIGWVNKVLDSTITKKGKFEFNRTLKGDEPERFTLTHIDKNTNSRIFAFSTKIKSKGFPFRSQYFMSAPIVLIQGKIIEMKRFSNNPSKNTILIESPISIGMQSKAMFDIECKFEQKPNAPSADEIKELIPKYSYSYYLLSLIIENKNSYNNIQITRLLKMFNSEVQNCKSAKALLDFTRKRSLSKKEVLEKLYNVEGNQENILSPNSNKSLVIFWASWCGPCRMEIPELKKLYAEYKSKSVDFISVSLDEDNKKWLDALRVEKMPWRQLIAKPEQKDFLRMVFQLNSSIPYLVLVDKDYKVLMNLTGFSKENTSLLTKNMDNQSK